MYLFGKESHMQTNHTASLRALAEQHGILIGAAASSRLLRTDSAYRETLAQEFNLLTIENELKFGPLCPRLGAYDFGPVEELVEFAQANDMRVRGHTLLWHQMNPDWLKEGNYNRNQALDLLRRHIFTTTGHFRGEIYAWDVVNEPVETNGGLRDSFWMHTIGPDYIEYAFRWAREADPGARLFINEYGAEGFNEKSTALYDLLKDLLKQGVPIDGVGLQMHVSITGSDAFSTPPAVHELFDNMKRLSDLGLEIHITEMDVQIHGVAGTAAEQLKKQAEVYEQVLGTALRNPQLKAFILWGFTDRYSWIPNFTGCPDAPLLFDEYYQPKPAYEAVYQTLETVCDKV
jgi:endo-1,4-beta-xylanase